jgi:hypothetical protein
MRTEQGDEAGWLGSWRAEEEAEQRLVVLRKDCADLGEVIPAARKLIGRSRAIRARGYSVAQITLEAVLVREDESG